MDADINSISDPFVTFQIQGEPEYTKKRTKTVDTNLNPVWDQTYELDVNDRNKDVLLVNLFDEDINKDDQMMDELKFQLNQWPIGTHIDYAENIKYKDQDAGKLYLGIDVIEPLPIQTFDERDIFLPEPVNDYCNFTLGNYPSTFSTDFTGYTNWSHSLSPLNSRDIQKHHHHHEGPAAQTRDVQLEPKATKAGESIKGRIVKANGLPKTDSDGSDTYVVLTVISKSGKDKKGEKVKTEIIHDTQDPEWNKEFEFVNAKTSDSLRAEVFQYHKILGDQCIACVEIQLNELKENQPIEQAFTLDKPPKVPKVVKKITDFGTLTLNLVHNVTYQ